MQSNTTEWNTNHFYFLNNTTLIDNYKYCAGRRRRVTSWRVSEATTTVPHRGNCCAYYYLVTPASSLSNTMDDDSPSTLCTNAPRYKKKVGSGHFPGEILSVQKIEPRSVHGGKLEWKEDFPLLRCAIETIEEDIIEEEDNMHNNKQY